jgi:hypothetical protein
MTDISPTPNAAAVASAPELVACAHCGHRDSGTYCSACGKELVEDESRTVAHEVWELLVVDRLNDAKEYATTTWYLIRHPLRFFATVLARPAARAGHVFPDPAPQPLPRGVVQRPVTFYLLSFLASVLVGKIVGVEATEFIPGLDDDFNNELLLLLVLASFAVYGVVFRWTSGRRISTEEAAIVSAYTMGAGTMATSLSTAFPSTLTIVGLAILYLLSGIPLIVLPRLYGMSRRRVLGSQAVAGFCAILALVLMMFGVYVALGIPLPE